MSYHRFQDAFWYTKDKGVFPKQGTLTIIPCLFLVANLFMTGGGRIFAYYILPPGI